MYEKKKEKQIKMKISYNLKKKQMNINKIICFFFTETKKLTGFYSSISDYIADLCIEKLKNYIIYKTN